jgi:hypothetical protein
LNGKPLAEGGTVVFEPEQRGKMAVGPIAADGTFELTTYQQGDGAIVGRHRVAVTPLVELVADTAQSQQSVQEPLIPHKYQAATSSGIVFDVKSGELNDCRLELVAE